MKVKQLALAIGISFTALAALPSHALIITNTVETSATINVNGDIKTDKSSAGLSGSSDVYGTLIPVVPDNGEQWVGGSNAYGDYTGHSKLQSQGIHYEDAGFFALPLEINTSASVLHKAVITNDSSSAQNLDFSFLINAGGIGLGYSSLYESGSYINAGYSASITVDGISIWNSGAKTELTYGFASSDANVTFTGTSLGGAIESEYAKDSYIWDDYYGSLNLGVLGAGKSLTLEYQINTYVNEYFSTSGYSHTPHAYFEDPFQFNTSPLFAVDRFTTSAVDTTEVPEPAGTLLLGAGLAALVFRRRKTRKTAV